MMNALLLALSLAAPEGALDAPATLASEFLEISPRAALTAASFPLQMSLFDVEASVEDPLPRLEPAVTPMTCVTFVLPSLAELTDLEPLRSSAGFDVPSIQPWLTIAPDKMREPMISWLKDWNQR